MQTWLSEEDRRWRSKGGGGGGGGVGALDGIFGVRGTLLVDLGWDGSGQGGMGMG